MVTSRLTSTRWRASCREPVDRLTLTIAGSSCGVMPDRDGQREQQGLEQRAGEGDVDHEDRDRQHRGDPDEQLGEAAQPGLEGRLGLLLAETHGDLAERRRRPGGDDDRPAGALVDDGAHERTRRQIDRGVR